MSIASPCINVCSMDAATALCVGCYRTLDEIALWGKAGDDVKLAILAAVDKRRAGHDPAGEQFRVDCDR
jgi:predicted Fe-S protein YdhL (DUF1289 family)